MAPGGPGRAIRRATPPVRGLRRRSLNHPVTTLCWEWCMIISQELTGHVPCGIWVLQYTFQEKIMMRRLAVSTLILTARPCASLAQATYGNILGAVSDPTGARIVGVILRVTNQGEAISRS